MNKNVAVAWGIIALIVIGGIIFYFGRNTDQSVPPPAPIPPPPTTQIPGKPIVNTQVSTALTDTTAVVSGTINPNGALTNYWFEYGRTAGSLTSNTSGQTIGSGYTTRAAPGYITGLTKDTTYYFRLVAENQLGRSMGAEYSFQTPHGYPPPPEGSAPRVRTIAATGISRTTANIKGEITSNNAVTQYWFEYGKTAELGNTTALVSLAEDAENVAAAVSLADLDPATTYYFRLNAQNQFGTANGAILNFKTLSPPAAAAPSVETKNATDVTKSVATLNGTVDANGLETTYWFEWSTDSLLGSALLRKTGEISAGSGTQKVSVKSDITGLTASTTYYFRLVAKNSAGTAKGERVTFRTK